MVILIYLHFVLNNDAIFKYMPASSNEFTVISYKETTHENKWGISSLATVEVSINGKELYIWWRGTASSAVCINTVIFNHCIISLMRWAGHVARMGEGRGVHRVLVGKPEGKSPLGRPRHTWEDNIKMDLQEVWEVVGTGWSWLRIGRGGGHLWVLWGTFGFQKCGEFLD